MKVIALLGIMILTGLFLTKISELDTIRINSRRNYFPPLVGKIIQNKFSERFTLARKMTFAYFSTDHVFRIAGYE